MNGFLHFGFDPVLANLHAWFHSYNGRQMIEVVIKENIFEMHNLNAHSSPLLAGTTGHFCSQFRPPGCSLVDPSILCSPCSLVDNNPASEPEAGYHGRSYARVSFRGSRLLVNIHGPEPLRKTTPVCKLEVDFTIALALLKKCHYLKKKVLRSLGHKTYASDFLLTFYKSFGIIKSYE